MAAFKITSSKTSEQDEKFDILVYKIGLQINDLAAL